MGHELRIARPDDAAAIARIYAPYAERTAISFEETAPTAAVMHERMNATLHSHPWLVLAGRGGLEGYAYAGPHRARAAYRWSADVAVYLDPEAPRRRGRGRALYAALLDLLAGQGFHRAFAGVALPNAASEGLHEALGFRAVGTFSQAGWKLGRWHDVRWYERRLGASDAPPEPPRPWREFASTDEARGILARASRPVTPPAP